MIALTHALRKDARVYFNGLPYASQPTHIELEILPTGGWGYDILPAHVRYARTLHKPLFVMTGRFHRSWGDFGGLRSEHSLLFDCCNAIANGGGCSVGDHMHPRGRLDAPVYDTIGRVFARVRALDAWSHQAHALADIAVISPHMAAVPAGPEPMPPAAWQATHGASRLLMELKCQFDVCDGSGDLSGYALLILPDDLPLTPELRRCIAAHLRCGGALLGSASAGVDAAKRAFVWPGYPAVFAGTEPFDPTYFEALSPVARDIPAMPIAIYTPGIAMRAAPGARVWARLWRPYFNRAAWDGCHEHLYTPPEKRLTRPAVVGRGRLAHFAFPVFGDYGLYAMPAAKYLVRNCIEKLLPRPLVKVEGMPSFGQVTVTAQKRRRMAHLLTYVPELRGPEMQVIEEPCVARDVALALRCDAARPVRRVYLAPGGENLPWREADGYIHTRVPAVEGYQMVVFE